MALAIHQHPFAAFCWKALIAIEHRGLDVERIPEDRTAIAALWPPATIPVLVDGDTVVPESTTIVEYLDRHGDAPPLVPADPDAAWRVRLWDRVLDAQVMLPMQRFVADVLRPEGSRDPYGVEQSAAQLAASWRLLDERIVGPWLCGETFSLADCTAAPGLFYGRIHVRWDDATHPRLAGYYARLRAQPAVDAVVEAARPHRPLFPLPWPDFAD